MTTLDTVKKAWTDAASKGKGFGDFPIPRIKITQSKVRLAAFEYPPDSDFYKDYDRSLLQVSKELLNKDPKTIEDIVRHEFVHVILWKEYPSVKAHHPPEFFRIFKNIFGYDTNKALSGVKTRIEILELALSYKLTSKAKAKDKMESILKSILPNIPDKTPKNTISLFNKEINYVSYRASLGKLDGLVIIANNYLRSDWFRIVLRVKTKDRQVISKDWTEL